LAIRYRIDGILQTHKILSKQSQNAIIARLKIMSQLNITETRLPQDGRCQTTIEGHPFDLRISTLPTVYGEKVVLRVLDVQSVHARLDHMHVHVRNKERMIQMLEKPTGVVLITGPTGSGKTSTLHAALLHLNRPHVSIVTVEDPVEYRVEGVNQVQVNPAIGYTFSVGLRAILRQDPNIIMVGEIRDRETAEIAIRASLTGHLVLSSIHTNDSISTITRLMDMGIEPFLVAAALSGIVSQRLVRQVCRDCRKAHKPTVREMQLFAERNIAIDAIYRGTGCVHCNNTGYRGRLAIHEVLVIDDEIRRYIMDRRPMEEMKAYAIEQRTLFLMDDGLMKVKEGLTTTEEILRVV
jgi:type IV pilus assembly protein PilB